LQLTAKDAKKDPLIGLRGPDDFQPWSGLHLQIVGSLCDLCELAVKRPGSAVHASAKGAPRDCRRRAVTMWKQIFFRGIVARSLFGGQWRAIELYAAANVTVFRALEPGERYQYVWQMVGYNRADTFAPPGTYRISFGQPVYTNPFEIKAQ